MQLKYKNTLSIQNEIIININFEIKHIEAHLKYFPTKKSRRCG